jgi:tripartite ATP-independent transporter DctP family solute receptor
MKRTLGLVAAAVAILLTQPASVAAQAQPITLKYAHAGGDTHTWQLWGQKFGELVAQRTQGRVKVEIYPGGQLGNERAITESVQLGTLDFAATGAPLNQWVPEIAVTDLPFLFRSWEHTFAVLDGPIGKELAARMLGKGFKLIGIDVLGFRHMTNNKRPLNSAADVRGLKLRVPEVAQWTLMTRALGGTPVPITLTEVYLALQQGVADGQENPPSTIRAQKFFEVQKYLSLTGHMMSTTWIVGSPRNFDALPRDVQTALLEAGRDASVYERNWVKAEDEKIVEFLKERGMVVNTPSDPESFRKATAPVWDQLGGKFPKEWIRTILDTK